MPKITINGESIYFPDSNQSPNWSPNIIRFANATAKALADVSSDYSIATNFVTLNNTDFQEVGKQIQLNDLVFPNSKYSSFEIKYVVFVNRDGTKTIENGIIRARSEGNLWTFYRTSDGDALVDFTILDTTGYVQISNLLTYATGEARISYSASMLNNIVS